MQRLGTLEVADVNARNLGSASASSSGMILHNLSQLKIHTPILCSWKHYLKIGVHFSFHFEIKYHGFGVNLVARGTLIPNENDKNVFLSLSLYLEIKLPLRCYYYFIKSA